jgi:hypothetical protein
LLNLPVLDGVEWQRVQGDAPAIEGNDAADAAAPELRRRGTRKNDEKDERKNAD